MIVAVTGATGFIGGHVVTDLSRRGHQVVAFGRRAPNAVSVPTGTSYKQWDIAAAPLDPDPSIEAVVHCAATVSDWQPWREQLAVNVGGATRVLAAFPSARVVHMSTASVYGKGNHTHVSEAAHLPARYDDAYSTTKRDAEKVMEASGRDVAVLRPHIVYGPGDRTLLPRVLGARRLGRQLAIGNGGNLLSVTHIDNLTQAVALALDAPAGNRVYNVADEAPARLRDLLDDIAGRFPGAGKGTLYIPTWAAHIAGRVLESAYRLARRPNPPLITRYAAHHMSATLTLDTTRIRDELAYRPTRSFHEAIATM